LQRTAKSVVSGENNLAEEILYIKEKESDAFYSKEKCT